GVECMGREPSLALAENAVRRPGPGIAGALLHGAGRLRRARALRRGSPAGMDRAARRPAHRRRRRRAADQCPQIRATWLVAHHLTASLADPDPGVAAMAPPAAGAAMSATLAIFVKTPGHSPVKTRLA